MAPRNSKLINRSACNRTDTGFVVILSQIAAKSRQEFVSGCRLLGDGARSWVSAEARGGGCHEGTVDPRMRR